MVFSPSDTDLHLQALLLARALLGPELTTVIVAADQTGSGTAYTGAEVILARRPRREIGPKGRTVAGLARSVTSVALRLLNETGDCRPQAETDAQVLDAIERSIANGTGVLLQIIDSSKLGWRAPSDHALTKLRRAGPVGSRSSSTPARCGSAARG